MTLTATERQFLHIAKAAVSDGEVTAESVDWPAVFALAGQQKLLPIVFESVRTRPCAHRRLQASTKRSARRDCTRSWSRVSFAAAYIR